MEVGNSPASYEPDEKRKLSLFHATVDGHWIDVLFEPKLLSTTVQIFFMVNRQVEIPLDLKNKEGSPSKSVIKILSTVRNIIARQLPEYIKKNNVQRIVFSGEGASRIELYRNKMVPFMNELLGPKWKHREQAEVSNILLDPDRVSKIHFFWEKQMRE